jgi:hypothetical protein
MPYKDSNSRTGEEHSQDDLTAKGALETPQPNRDPETQEDTVSAPMVNHKGWEQK